MIDLPKLELPRAFRRATGPMAWLGQYRKVKRGLAERPVILVANPVGEWRQSLRLTDLPRPQSLDGMAKQALGGREESDRVRQFHVQFKRGFIFPLGVKGECDGWPQRLEHTNGAAPTLRTRGSDDPQKFFAELRRQIRRRLKAHREVNRQRISRRQYARSFTRKAAPMALAASGS